jgi:hypothetical protein
VSRWPRRRCRPEGGRRPPDRLALGRVEEVVTGRSDRRIDRPLLPERPPSRRRVSGTRAHAGVRGGLTPRTGVRTLPPAGQQHGHVVAPAVATADMATHAALSRTHARNHCHRRPQPRPSQVNMVVSGRHGHPGRPRGTGADVPQTAGHFRCGRPPGGDRASAVFPGNRIRPRGAVPVAPGLVGQRAGGVARPTRCGRAASSRGLRVRRCGSARRTGRRGRRSPSRG